ncbi:MAG: pyruvate kinase [Pseudomonadota bacterium]
MIRRTKIVATLGPATSSYEVLTKCIQAGANVVRLNFSHGTAEQHATSSELVRKIAKENDVEVAIMADLQGPKLRIGKFIEGSVTLNAGAHFILDTEHPLDAGNSQVVGVEYKALADDIQSGDILLLDDGRLVMEALNVSDHQIECLVLTGGKLSDNKGINRQGGGLSAPALTEKDKRDIRYAAEMDVDYVAVSFPRRKEDLELARELIKETKTNPQLIAKIERAEIVTNLHLMDEIIVASDGVMIARGDLGVEIGDATLISVQKHIIQRARELNRIVITATQMMESMISNPIPTRAEVFDVANAVLDGTDAVMLSAETAVGQYPIEVIQAMSRACVGAEKQLTEMVRSKSRFVARIDEAIAISAMETANLLDGVKAIVCLSESGATPKWMSRIRSGIPIYSLSRHYKTHAKVCLMRGVYPISFDPTQYERSEVNKAAIALLKAKGIVQDGEQVVLTKGDNIGLEGGTNALKILTVGRVN